MRLKINRSAALAAACAAGLSSSFASAQTWNAWGDLGAGGVSMLNSGSATRSPRQFGLTVANNTVFGTWDSGDAGNSINGGPEVFRTTTPGTANITHVALNPTNDPTGIYAAPDKIIYNPADGNLYMRASGTVDWDNTANNPPIYPTGSKAGLIKMNTSLASQNVLFQPAVDAAPGVTSEITGMALDTDSGNVLFCTNNRYGPQTTNVYYYNPSGAGSITNLLTTIGGQAAQQRMEGLVYLGPDSADPTKGRIAELNAGSGGNGAAGAQQINFFTYDPTVTADSQTATSNDFLGNTLAAAQGSPNTGGITAALWDRTHQSLHLLNRMRSNGALTNTTFYPAQLANPNELNYTTLAPAGVTNIRKSEWNSPLPGSTLGNNAGSGANYVDINTGVLTPDGNILLAFNGATPYGITDAQTRLWMKTTATPDGGIARTTSSDQTLWTDLGVIDSGGGQVVSITTGNIGSGSLGFGKNSYDVWAMTQDRLSGNLKLSSSATDWTSRLSWDTNDTFPGSGGPTPTGDWDGVADNFNTDPAGGAGTLTDTTTSSTVVGFAAGADATGAYTVTVSGTQTARRVDFETGSVTLSGGTLNVPTYDVPAGVTGTIASDITGNFEKRQAGKLVLAGTKTNTGTTTVSAGTLQYADPTALYNDTPANWTAANITVKPGAILALNVGAPTEFDSTDINAISAIGSGSGGFLSGSSLGLDTTNATGGTFTHAGTIANPNGGANALIITKQGANELKLSGSNTYTGGTVVNGGTLTAESGSALGAATGPLTVNSTLGTSNAVTVNLFTGAPNTTGNLSGSISGAGNTATINNGGQLYTVNQTAATSYPGAIAGTGGFTLGASSTGTLSLTNATNSYSGVTTVSGGTLAVSTLANVNSPSSIGSGSVGGSAADLVLNGGTLAFAGTTSQNSNRSFTYVSGTLSSTSSNNSAINFNGAGAVAYGGSGTRTINLGGTSTGANTIGLSISNNGADAVGVTKSGAGTWRLPNDTNNFTGPTTINGGVLEATSVGNAGAASAIGAGSEVTINGGTLRYIGGASQSSNRQITWPSSGAATIDASGTVGAATLSMGGTLNQTGAAANHTLTLAGSNVGDGVLSGTNAAINGGKNTFSSNITNISTSQADFLDTSVVKSGTGTWVMSGNNSYLGSTTVNGGTLILTGAQAFGNPADIGRGAGATAHTANNNLFINNSGTNVILSETAPTYIEKGSSAAGSTLTLRGQRLNFMWGSSTNGGQALSYAGVITGSGGVYLGPLTDGDGINGTPTAFFGIAPGVKPTFPANLAADRAPNFSAANTYTGGTHLQGGGLIISNLNGVGPDNSDLDVNNLRSNSNGGVVTLTLSTPAGSVKVSNFFGKILPSASGPVNTMTINLNTGGQRVLEVLQVGDTVYEGGLSGQNANAGGGEFRLAAGSTGTLTFIGSTASANGVASAAAQTATIAGGGMANGGVVRINGGTLLLKTPGALSVGNLPVSGPLTREPGTGPTINTGGSGVIVSAGGTLAVNVGGAAPVWNPGDSPLALNAPGKPVVGAEWTAGDVDRIRNVGTFLPGSFLGIDTTNAVGTFTYGSSIGGLNINNAANGSPAQNDNNGMGVVKLGAGTLDLTGTNTYTGGTTVNAGTLIVNRLHGLADDGSGTPNPVSITAGTLQVRESSPTIASGHPGGNNAFVSRPGSTITIANNGGDIVSLNPTTVTPRIYNGKLDLTNNDLVIDYSATSPIADIEDMIRAGRNGGNWLGNGITSSTAGSIAAAGAYTLGVIDNATPGITPFTTFSDQTVDTTTVLVKFVHRSDINMDGVVTFSDSVRFNGNYSEGTPTRWVFGDLNYNGVSDFGDSVLFNGGYDEALASLPEPASLSLLSLAALGVARRRRRRA